MWILPSYSRPQNCAEVVSHVNALGFESGGIVFVNGNHEQYEDSLRKIDLGCWRMVLSQSGNLGALGALNYVFNQYPNESFYGFLADDEYVQTSRWDRTLIAAAGAWRVSHGNDCHQSGLRIQGGVCIGGELARAVGYLAIPGCWHCFGLDNMWEVIAKHLGLQHFCFDVKIVHQHPQFDSGTMDECYRLGESRYQDDQRVFEAWHRNEAPGIIARIKERLCVQMTKVVHQKVSYTTF
jgi:hypothetical protein